MRRHNIAVFLIAVTLPCWIGCGGPAKPQSTVPTQPAISATADAQEYIEVVSGTVEKTGDSFTGKATIKALKPIPQATFNLVYKPMIWTPEGQRMSESKSIQVQGPLKGDEREISFSFPAAGPEGGRTVEIWMVQIPAE